MYSSTYLHINFYFRCDSNKQWSNSKARLARKIRKSPENRGKLPKLSSGNWKIKKMLRNCVRKWNISKAGWNLVQKIILNKLERVGKEFIPVMFIIKKIARTNCINVLRKHKNNRAWEIFGKIRINIYVGRIQLNLNLLNGFSRFYWVFWK